MRCLAPYRKTIVGAAVSAIATYLATRGMQISENDKTQLIAIIGVLTGGSVYTAPNDPA